MFRVSAFGVLLLLTASINPTPPIHPQIVNPGGAGGGVLLVSCNIGNGSISGTTDLWAQQCPFTGGNNGSVMAGAGTVSQLRVRFATALAGTDSLAVTVFKNGSTATMTCTVAASTQTCSTTANSFTYIDGDTLGFHTVCTGAGACNSGGGVSFALKITGAS